MSLSLLEMRRKRSMLLVIEMDDINDIFILYENYWKPRKRLNDGDDE